MSTSSLILEDNTILEGNSFGRDADAHGEVVFNTGMVGYPEALTDPSYRGQILVLTYPLIGNYGVASNAKIKMQNAKLQLKIQNYPYESEKIQIAGLVVSEYCKNYSHPSALQSLGSWLKSENIPAIDGVDTRALTQKLRERGTMLGKISKPPSYAKATAGKQLKSQNFTDPNKTNLVAEVSCKEPIIYEPWNMEYGIWNILLYDCGVKFNIIRCLLKRGCRVIRVPWDYQIQNAKIKMQNENVKFKIDGIVISNGPGDPLICGKTIEEIKKVVSCQLPVASCPVLGICLGNQILALAAGAKTYKLKYGHRGQNQPVIMEHGTDNMTQQRKAFITSQNHGFAVDTNTLPSDFEPWFTNLNDGTNEGIRHKTKPWMSVQFHPEACPGPTDTEWVFDEWLALVKSKIKM